MCDQTMPYEVGTFVWVKLNNSVWWPGKVVDISTIPEEIQESVNKKKENYKAIVFFENEKKYKVVVNMDEVCLYSSPKKLEFVEKGYSLFLKQKAGKPVEIDINMKYFILDVEKIESKGGDITIFNQFDKKETEKNDCDDTFDMMGLLPTPDWVKEEPLWETNGYIQKAKEWATLRRPTLRYPPMPLPAVKYPPPFTPELATSFTPPPIFHEIIPNDKPLKPGVVRVQLRVTPDEYDDVKDEYLTNEELQKHPLFLQAMEAIRTGNTEDVFIEIRNVNKDDLSKLEKLLE